MNTNIKPSQADDPLSEAIDERFETIVARIAAGDRQALLEPATLATLMVFAMRDRPDGSVRDAQPAANRSHGNPVEKHGAANQRPCENEDDEEIGEFPGSNLCNAELVDEIWRAHNAVGTWHIHLDQMLVVLTNRIDDLEDPPWLRDANSSAA